MYGMPSDVLRGKLGREDAAPQQFQAVASFLEQCFNADDLHTFLSRHGDTGGAIDPSHIIGNAACDSGDQHPDDVETMLDVEMIMSLSDSTTYLYYESGRMPGGIYNEPFLSWLERINTPDGSPPGPTVFSISYSDWEPSVTDAYKTRVEIELMKLAVRGMTVVVASGDAGVEGAQRLPNSAWPDHTCSAGDRFIPDWPASSEWVTAVGGHGKTSTESASLSGGGFSDFFSVPPWQNSAVNSYHANRVANSQPDISLYNANGRGIPDVACAAVDVEITVNGASSAVSGTSAATPIFAAILADLNRRRIAAGLPSLGFVNPLLYAHADDAFVDITSGPSNAGCGSVGFAPVVGWDPITGLGAPHYPSLLAAALCPNDNMCIS
jgi:tripeptidyl-peptidase-1